MSCLELCCGTHSFGKVFSKHYNVVSVDNEPTFKPTICTDILEWDYKVYATDAFEFIWASPPCVSFSNMAGGRHRDKTTLEPKTDVGKQGDLILNKCIEIIEYFKPKYFCIENPRGYMRKMNVLKNIDRATINYCKYGSPYFKPTDLFNNFDYVGRLCKYERNGIKVDCNHLRVKGKHTDRERGGIQRASKLQSYSIPAGLFEDMIDNYITIK